MPGREQIRRVAQRQDEASQRGQAPSTSVASTSVASDGLDGLLDEIDQVLASDAEDYVRSFVQKGGQ